MDFGSTLDAVIGLSYVFLLLSLVVSAANELIASALRLRARALEGWVSGALGSVVKGQLYRDPLVNPLGSDAKRGPSYVPAAAFASALLQTLKNPPRMEDPAVAKIPERDPAGAPAAQTPTPTEKPWAQILAEVADPNLRRLLVTLHQHVGEDATRMHAALEAWYDAAMDRLSGRYKRWVQAITVVLGGLVAVVFNVDSVSLLGRLGHDAHLGAALVDTAVKVSEGKDAEGIPTGHDVVQHLRDLTADIGKLPFGWTAEFEAAEADAVLQAERDAGTDAKARAAAEDHARALARRWDRRADAILGAVPNRIAGWLLTTVAVSLGAPFWFDVLKRFVNLRGSGPPPDRKRPRVGTSRARGHPVA